MPQTPPGFASTQDSIDRLDVTSDRLTGRGGLPLFSRYLTSTGVLSDLERLFGSMRRSAKGLPVSALFKQLFCFLLDGTDRHLTAFDRLKKDAGYAGAIETRISAMASSHQVKRFFGRFSWYGIFRFRPLLQQLFLWRLQREQPRRIVLGVDTMIMDNSEADVRHGVEPTYKKGVKGFQPLQVTWGRYLIDAVFRGGSKHSNYSDTVIKAIDHLVCLIRSRYKDVPIIIRMDAGFFDQEIMTFLESIGVVYLIGGKLYDDLVEQADEAMENAWHTHRKKKSTWRFLEMLDLRGSWKKETGFRRAIFSRTVVEEGQYVMDFSTTTSVFYTNLTFHSEIGKALRAAGHGDLLSGHTLMTLYHDRGSDELVHRALKAFAHEELPFKRFAPNAAFYYTMLVAFFLYEAFKEDVCEGAVDKASYATTLRRKVIDIAAKLVRTGGKTVLKVTEATCEALDLKTMWDRAARAPAFAWQ